MSVKIRFFGTFSIEYDDRSISEGDNRSKKLWKLLEYIVANRDRHIPQEELVALLWGESREEESFGDNPISSLKTLLHRVRNTLERLDFIGSRKLILQRSGAYYWNPEIACVIDTEEFEQAAADMERTPPSEEKLNHALKAMALYKGHFLSNKYDEPWAKDACEHYRAIYLTCYETAIELLLADKQYDEIVFLSEHAIEIDPSQEIFYYHLISALIQKASYDEALEVYENVLNLFYNTYRKTPSDKLRSLYRSIVKSSNSAELDIAIIQENLRDTCTDRPIECEYDTFKLLYELCRIHSEQSGRAVYLVLFTVSGAGSEKMPSGKYLDRALEQLCGLLNQALRKGDFYTRYSVTQLLVSAQMESEDALFAFLKKVQNHFKSSNLSLPVEITFKADLVS